MEEFPFLVASLSFEHVLKTKHGQGRQVDYLRPVVEGHEGEDDADHVEEVEGPDVEED